MDFLYLSSLSRLKPLLGIGLLGLALGACGDDSAGSQVLDANESPTRLRVNARNDKPGPATIVVKGFNLRAEEIFNEELIFDADDNTFSIKTLDFPLNATVLRFTFVDDVSNGPGDDDRNAYIDYFRLKDQRFEAENFDRTGGMDPKFAGCAPATIADGDNAGARFVADCGNEDDFVEFDLPPRV